MTSEARKQAWAKSYTLVQWEYCATHAVWRFINQSGREITVHLMVPKAYGISPRSPCESRHKYPPLSGVALPLLKLVPPEQYALAVAMQLTRNHAPWR